MATDIEKKLVLLDAKFQSLSSDRKLLLQALQELLPLLEEQRQLLNLQTFLTFVNPPISPENLTQLSLADTERKGKEAAIKDGQQRELIELEIRATLDTEAAKRRAQN